MSQTQIKEILSSMCHIVLKKFVGCKRLSHEVLLTIQEHDDPYSVVLDWTHYMCVTCGQ